MTRPGPAPPPAALLVWAGGLLLFLLAFRGGLAPELPDVYGVLARSFVEGRLDLDPVQGGHDLVPFGGRYYAPQGPLPALLLMPAALAMGPGVNVGLLQFALHFVNLLLLRAIARRLGYSEPQAAAFAFLFVFATAYFGVAKISSYTYLAHVVCVALGLAAVLLYLRGDSWGWIGLCFAGILATRVTAAIGLLLFALLLLRRWRGRDPLARRDALLLLAPVALAALLLAAYNQARFGTPWETGYRLQQISVPVIAGNRAHGIFSLRHLPGNLYALLLHAPEPVLLEAGSTVLAYPYLRPSPWGLGLVFLSPFLALLLLGRARDPMVPLLWVTIAAIAAPLLLYYGIGVKQYGYRYGLDFFPFVYWLFLLKVREDAGARLAWLGAACVAFNLWLGASYR